MGPFPTLTPEQKQFLAHACAFIDQAPSRQEIDQLLTLAAMLLPEPVTELLAKRASGVRAGALDSHSLLTPWMQ